MASAVPPNTKRRPPKILPSPPRVGYHSIVLATASIPGPLRPCDQSRPDRTDPSDPRLPEQRYPSRCCLGTDDDLLNRYEYDGLNRRTIMQSQGGHTYAHYFNTAWQMIEMRRNDDTDPEWQHVWDLRYIDAPLIWWRDHNRDGTIDNTLYFTNDANMNVTALVDATSGNVTERYQYTPYGQVTVLDANWSDDADGISDVWNPILFQGTYWQTQSGTYLVRHRQLHPTLGRWMQRDPLGYPDGYNAYAAYHVQRSRNDPFGLATGKRWKPMLILESIKQPKRKGIIKPEGLFRSGLFGDARIDVELVYSFNDDSVLVHSKATVRQSTLLGENSSESDATNSHLFYCEEGSDGLPRMKKTKWGFTAQTFDYEIDGKTNISQYIHNGTQLQGYGIQTIAFVASKVETRGPIGFFFAFATAEAGENMTIDGQFVLDVLSVLTGGESVPTGGLLKKEYGSELSEGEFFKGIWECVCDN